MALLTAPRWTLRIAVQRDWPGVYGRYLDVVHEELERIFEGGDATRLAEGWERGDLRVESLVLAHAYGHLSPLVDRERRVADSPAEGLRRAKME